MTGVLPTLLNRFLPANHKLSTAPISRFPFHPPAKSPTVEQVTYTPPMQTCGRFGCTNLTDIYNQTYV
jgi:hypothetical protein